MNSTKNTSGLQFAFGEQCHPGKRRSENQDSVAHGDTPWGPAFVLSDGVGGYAGGAEAAQIVTTGFLRHMRNTAAGTHPETAVREAAAKVNSEVFAAAQSGDSSRRRMSATLVFTLLTKTEAQAEAYIGNLGDSRAYIVQHNKLSQITTDHTTAQNLVAAGLLEPAAAENHHDAGTLSKSVGSMSSVNTPIWRVALEPGARLLLCSDGLHAFVKEESIRQVMTNTKETPDQLAKTLLTMALDAGGPDNISIQVIQVGIGKCGTAHSLAQRKAWIIAGAGIAFAAMSWGGVALYQAWQGGVTHQQFASIQKASPTQTSGPARRPAAKSVPVGPQHPVTGDNHGPQQQKSASANQSVPKAPPKLRVVDVAPLATDQDFLKQLRPVEQLNPDKKKACLSQESDHRVVYFRPEAINRPEVNLEAIKRSYRMVQYSSYIEAACGSYDLLFLPEKPATRAVLTHDMKRNRNRVTGKVDQAIDNVIRK